MSTIKAKDALDRLIKKTRSHYYKPIQVAEILYKSRIGSDLNLSDLESYRNSSKQWRDEISTILVGRKCTSTQKFQDNLFEKNAIPPDLLITLDSINKETNGGVESYIYLSFAQKLNTIYEITNDLEDVKVEDFDFNKLIDSFIHDSGLKRSVDKMYEVTTYALFSTLVRALDTQVTLKINSSDDDIKVDFKEFIHSVLGLANQTYEKTISADIFRVGVTNAADRGLDMWSNFGPVVQVKHLTLQSETVEEIAGGITADRIVIVCLDCERKPIENLLRQVGWGGRIQSIVVLSDLENWYKKCLSEKYKESLGKQLLKDLFREFVLEFPSYNTIKPFLKRRGYSKNLLPSDWR